MFLKEYAAKELKYLRKQKKINQKELAEELTHHKIVRENELVKEGKKSKPDLTPITRQTVSKYELGSLGMNQDILFDLSTIFEVPIDVFFPSRENAVEELSRSRQHTKTIYDEDGYSIEIKSDVPFEELDKEKQQDYIDAAMERLLHIKKETKKTGK